MSTKQLHKQWRKQFNEDCLKRDENKCVFCGKTENLDVHHILDRHLMPNGGYVKENGITLCEEHHWKAEEYHMGGDPEAGFYPMDLWNKIGSSYEEALEKSNKLS